MSDLQCTVVLVTVESLESAQKMAHFLVEHHLAACVNFYPIHSVYSWQGEIQSENEWQLVIKTQLEKFSALETQIKELHSYEVPEIIALPILVGHQPYLDWIVDR